MPTTVTTNADHTVTVNFDGVDYKFRWSDVAYSVESITAITIDRTRHNL